MPNIKISDLETIAPGFDPDLVFVELQTTVNGELVSRKATASELTAGASPLNADYVTVTPNAILPNERILTGDANIDITDGGAGGNIVVSMGDMAQATVKGRADGAGTGIPIDLTPAQLNGILASGGFDPYFLLTATGRVVGSDAGTSQSGDNVILGGALAGDLNIADGVIALGQNALAIAADTDFAGSIAIGRNAGALLGATRDPWILIGDGAAANITAQSFHDGNTIIGTRALGALGGTTNVQHATIIGHDAVSDMTGASGLGVINSSVVIGGDAGNGNVGASISSSVIIGRNACGDMGVGGATSVIAIGNQAGESFAGATLTVVIGSNAAANAQNMDNSIVIGCNTAAFGVASTDNQIIIGHGSIPGILTGETNVLIGNSQGISGTQLDYDHCIIIGHLAGNEFVDDQNIFAIEQPQGNTSSLARPYLFGNMLEGNLALLNIAAMTGGTELGTRILPAWADAAPTAGQGVFSMYGAGTDLAATTDADFVHFFVASADSTLTLRYPGGGDVTLLHDGSDAIIQTNIIVGDPVTDGKLFINTTTGIGAAGGSISTTTPGLVSIYGAGFSGNGQAGNVEIWGGYADGTTSAAIGGDLILWGGSGGGNDAQGGNAMLIGGFGDVDPGFALVRGGTPTTGGNGAEARVIGGAGFAGNSIGGDAVVTGGAGVGSGQGGAVVITGGILGPVDGGNSGGVVSLVGGASGATNGDGGDINLTPGAGTGSGVDGQILMPQRNLATAPTLAFGDGDSGFYEESDDTITVTLGGTAHWDFNFATFRGNSGVSLVDSAPTGTAPNIRPGNADNNTGIGSAAADQLSLIAGGLEVLRLVETGVAASDQVRIGPAGIIGSAATPSLAFGDGNTGFYETADNDLFLTTGGFDRFRFHSTGIRAATAGGFLLNTDTPAANDPNLIPAETDTNTGIGWAAADQLSLVAGGVEGLRFTELNSGVLQVPSAAVTVTAFAGGGQGSATALIHSYNVITTVATAGDSVRLPDVFAVNSLIYIKNDDAAEAADVFPASGDDLGAGVNVAVSLAAGDSLTFMATVANSTWTVLISSAGAGSSAEFDNLLLSQTPGSHAASPTLRFGDGDTGFYEVVDGTINLSNEGNDKLQFGINSLSCSVNADSFTLLYQSASATTPTFVPDKSDTNTGIGANGADQLSLIAGGVEGLRFTELNSGVLQVPSAALSITAFAGGGQGSAVALIHSYNVITVVASDGDSVRLPSVFSINSIIYIKNNDSAQAADVFPASGDNLGAGVDTAVSLAAGESLTFIATVADSTWTLLIVATGGGGAGADSDGARRSVGVPNATGSYIDYTDIVVSPPSTGFYTVDITLGWSGNDANITGLDLTWSVGSGTIPSSQGTWITTINTAPGGVESTTVDGGTLSGGVMPVADGTVSYVSQFHGIWDVGATLPTDIQLEFRREGSSGTVTGAPNASISIRKFADL